MTAPALFEDRPLHPVVQKVWLYSSLISTLIFGAILIAVETVVIFASDNYLLKFPIFTVAFTLILLFWSIWIPKRQYANWRYSLRPHDLALSYGIVWKTRRCVARTKVQHVDINSGPLDRKFGVVQVVIYAAGALGAVGTIPGLEPLEAEELRKALLESRELDA